MEIERFIDEGSIRFAVSGRLTAETAEALSRAVEAALTETRKLILDFKEMEFVASAGLRVILSAKKKLDAGDGELVIRNVNELVMNVFELVGFDRILTFE